MNIETCIQKLTLEEKAALLQGKSNWRTHGIPRLGIPEICQKSCALREV